MTDENVLADMHGQTAQLSWSELERFFAAGKLMQVSAGLDLVAVAEAFASDRAATVAGWLEAGDLQGISDEQARQWQAQDAVLWAVVAAPWVLVQSVDKRNATVANQPNGDTGGH